MNRKIDELQKENKKLKASLTDLINKFNKFGSSQP
jgi:uncharacterized coiled-coil protein SlyX